MKVKGDKNNMSNTTTKTAGKKTANTASVADTQPAAQTNEELLKKIEALQKELAEAKAAVQPKAEAKAVAQPIYVNAPTTDVEVVYTSHSMGHMEGKLFSIDATVFGERFSLERNQFDELVGKYRHWFKDGRLAVSYKNVDIAALKDLPTEADIGLRVEDLRNLGNMSVEEIEALWNGIKVESLQMSLVNYYKEKYSENAPGFRDRARIDCLNRLTDGGFEFEAATIGGRRYKLPVRDFNPSVEQDD